MQPWECNVPAWESPTGYYILDKNLNTRRNYLVRMRLKYTRCVWRKIIDKAYFLACKKSPVNLTCFSRDGIFLRYAKSNVLSRRVRRRKHKIQELKIMRVSLTRLNTYGRRYVTTRGNSLDTAMKHAAQVDAHHRCNTQLVVDSILTFA